MLPVPIEAVIAPFTQMRRDMILRIAGIALAGFSASAIGTLFFETLGAGVIAAMGWKAQFAEVARFLGSHGFCAMIGPAPTPLPTQVAMIVAGGVGLPHRQFGLAILLGRRARVFALGLLVRLWWNRVVGSVVLRA